MPLISVDRLREFAQTPDVELRLMDGDGEHPQIETREGTLGGRIGRWFAIRGDEDRTGKQAEYGGAHREVYQSLREHYGEEVADKAFQAGGLGRANRHGAWEMDTNHPLTGRHIAKMLQTADRESSRNDGIAGWLGNLRQLGQDHGLQVFLGEKLSGPQANIAQFGTVTEADRDRRLNDDSPHQEGLWILELKSKKDDEAVRLGFHCHKSNPGMYTVTHGGDTYNVNRSDLPAWLEAFSRDSYPDGLTDGALYRGEDNAAALFAARHRQNGDLEGMTRRGKGLPEWVERGLDVVEQGNVVLRAYTQRPLDPQQIPRDEHAFQARINEQLASINRLLADDPDRLVRDQIRRDEDSAIKQGVGTVVEMQLSTSGLAPNLQTEIDKALTDELDAALSEMRDDGMQSLTEDGALGRLADRLSQKLDEKLAKTELGSQDRGTVLQNFGRALAQALDETRGQRLGPELERTQRVGLIPTEIATELRRQRASLQAMLGVVDPPVLEKHHPMEGLEVKFADDKSLEKVTPLNLRLRNEAGRTVADIPGLFGQPPQQGQRLQRYEQPRHPIPLFQDVSGRHLVRLASDKAGVPDKGQANAPSARLAEQMSPDSDTFPKVKVQVGEHAGRDIEGVMQGAQLLTDADGEALNLSPEQQCALTRFLDGRAFEEMYEQAVRRLLPSGTPGECGAIDVAVRTRWDDNHQPLFEISFRSRLPPTDGVVAFRVDDGENPDESRTRRVKANDLQLSATLHVPIGELQKNEPTLVTLDEPVLVFLKPRNDLGV